MTLDCSRIAKEIAMMRGLFVDGKRKEQEISEKFSKKTSRLLPETGRSQATNLKTQKPTNFKWIEMHQSQVKMCFLRGPLR